jgi:mannonate dehydratase
MFIHSWRWFGPDDPVTLDQVVQTGAVNIVTALHQVPVGMVWPSDQIRQRKELIEASGLTWTVVESVPVHEDIKTRTGNYRECIDNFRQTLVNLGRENISTLCYNFMPALDWSRTSLTERNRDGSQRSGFEFIHFAALDIHLLKRPDAEASYPAAVRKQAKSYFERLDEGGLKELEDTFLLGFPGSGESFSLEEVLQRIDRYRKIDRNIYMSNLLKFLREIVPVAEEQGIKLAIHPDDPPWPLLGLPRVVSTLHDAEEIIRAVDSPANGITFCTGSFGAAYTNDLPSMAKQLAHRINFLHIRNVVRDEGYNFHEENLLEGDVNVAGILETMILEDLHREKRIPGYTGIPVRPDHGAKILEDFRQNTYPGYSLYGRLKNLSEIRGLEAGIRQSLRMNRP